MLTSLFGELGLNRLPAEPADRAAAMATVVDSDVVVDGDAALSMRSHLAATRTDLGQASSMITLFDPSGLWAPQVVRALADAGAQQVERLNLRERGTLRTLAVIERTNVPRHKAGPLKVYHADTRHSGIGQEDLACVLAEASHLTAVIVGGMPPHAVTSLLRTLMSATRQPEWQCPWLVFILPPGVGALRRRILDQDWPPQVRIAAMSESLNGPASVWNAVLTAWEAAARDPSRPANPAIAATSVGTAADSSASALSPPQWLTRAMAGAGRVEGVLAVGMVDLDSGDLLACDAQEGWGTEIRRLAAALCASRRAHLAAGGPELAPPDEILVSTGQRQALLKLLAGSEVLAWVALVDRPHANMALLRFRMLEAERSFQ